MLLAEPQEAMFLELLILARSALPHALESGLFPGILEICLEDLGLFLGNSHKVLDTGTPH
jgi:hypothetical protein